MKDFWNERYSSKSFAYGKNPNNYFKQEIDKLQSGKLLLPAEGEGRNSVYAASNDWEVTACDLSEEGKEKALLLAGESNVDLKYDVGDFGALNYTENSFDAIALIYAHFPPNKKTAYHQLIDKYLKPNGYLIFEGFSKNHLKYNSVNPKVGGPKNDAVLFSIDEIKNNFKNYNFFTLTEEEIELKEGDFHIGTASVIRFVARKK